MKGLTFKQREMLNFIQHFIEKNHYSPSYREIQAHFAFSSVGSVYKYIQTLKRKGALIAETHCSRTLTPSSPSLPIPNKGEIELPFIGHIAAGYPIEIFIKAQTLSVPAFLVPHPELTYLLRVQGDALNGELMSDGDLLLVEARQEAQAGETVVVLLNQHEALIKRYYPEGQYIRLEDSQHQSLILRQNSIAIQGILTGLIRNY